MASPLIISLYMLRAWASIALAWVAEPELQELDSERVTAPKALRELASGVALPRARHAVVELGEQEDPAAGRAQQRGRRIRFAAALRVPRHHAQALGWGGSFARRRA